MKREYIIVMSIIVAVVMTMMSGLIDTTPKGFALGVLYGYPLSWIHIAYQTTFVIIWGGLIFDLVVWFAIVLLISVITNFIRNAVKLLNIYPI